MSKIIIHNDTDESDRFIVERVSNVIADGLVSGQPDKPQYCYVTSFTSRVDGSITRVVASRKGDTHTFKVFIEKPYP